MCLSVYLIYRKHKILNDHWNDLKFHFSQLISLFRTYISFSSSCMVYGTLKLHPLNHFSIYTTGKIPHVLRSRPITRNCTTLAWHIRKGGGA